MTHEYVMVLTTLPADADGVAWEINLLRGAIYVIEHVDTGLQRPIDLTTRTDERICLPFKVQ